MRIKKKTIILSGFLVVILVFLVIAATKNRQMLGLILLPSRQYEPTEIPTDTTDLFEYDGYIKNEIAYIYVQGGPNWELFDRKISPFNWMSHSGKYLKVFPYQSQIINQTILFSTPILTDRQAQREVEVSAEMLYRTIKYFKNQDKKVYVFCISHGSQIGLEMLRNYPNISNGLALTMIRFDVNIEAIDLTSGGKVPYFNSKQEVTSRYLLPKFLRFQRLNSRVENMATLMKVSQNRYTELLKDKDLTNVVYVFGKYDNKVGCPNQHEIDFLKNKGVSVLELNCGHDDLANSVYLDKINQILIN